MKQLIFAAMCTLLSLNALTQASYFSITGKVINAETKAPMQGASVFAENTTLGTTTDQDGNFFLQLPNGGYSLVVSYTGFNTQNERVTNNNTGQTSYQFELTAKEKMMADVAIVSTGEVKNGWEKYGSFFLEEFIGKTENSRLCKIKNPEVIKFFFSRKKNRLKILANEPLIIENNSLGYNIRYDLDSFIHEYNNDITLYTGYPLYEEMIDSSEIQKSKWATARQNAYNGSVLHFMRSLYKMELEEEGFEIQVMTKQNGKETALQVDDFYKALNYQPADSINFAKILPTQLQIGVIYKDEKPAADYLKENKDAPSKFQFSTINFQPNQTISIEQNGFYFDQNDIIISDYWEWNKMADALPYDYIP